MTTDVAVREQGGALVQADNPHEFVEKITSVAKELVAVVEGQKLYTMISGRKHVRVEGWTFLGSMMGTLGHGVYAVTEWTRPLVNELGETTGWEARVEARTIEGQVVGAAEAMCTRQEKTWKDRDEFALRSMATTRATSKALRVPLGFVMQLAGFDPTPEEEMPQDPPVTSRQTTTSRSPEPLLGASVEAEAHLRGLLVSMGKRPEEITAIFDEHQAKTGLDYLDAPWMLDQTEKASRHLTRQAAASAGDESLFQAPAGASA